MVLWAVATNTSVRTCAVVYDERPTIEGGRLEAFGLGGSSEGIGVALVFVVVETKSFR